MKNTVIFLIVLLYWWGNSSGDEGEEPRCGQLKYPDAVETTCDTWPSYLRPPSIKCNKTENDTRAFNSAVRRSEILEDDEKRIIVMELGQDPQWKTGKELKAILTTGLTYIDLTNVGKFRVDKSGKLIDESRGKRKRSNMTFPIPTEIRFPNEVLSMTQSLDIEKIKEIVITLATAFKNRDGDEGEVHEGPKAANWVRDYAQKLIDKYAGPCAGVYEWQHIEVNRVFGIYMMPMKTIIVRLLGSNLFLSDEVIILSAHLDSISRDKDFRQNRLAPGADDNASGCAALLETLKVLMEAKFRPRRTIEFHFYSYEEVGLFGSTNIAKYYYKYKVNVVGNLNLDVVGYLPNPESNKIAISYRNTHEGLNKFIEMLMDKYVGIPWENSEVCKGCNSDHASWSYFDFPAAFPHEKIISPLIHKKNDTVDTVNFEYLFEFTKLALAFAVEYGEPVPKIKGK